MFNSVRRITRLQDLTEDVRIAESQYREAKWKSDPKMLEHKIFAQVTIIQAAQDEIERLKSDAVEAEHELPKLLKNVAVRRQAVAAWVNRVDVSRLQDMVKKMEDLSARVREAEAPSRATSEAPTGEPGSTQEEPEVQG